MDINTIKELERKYWEAETTPEEEAILRQAAVEVPHCLSPAFLALADYALEEMPGLDDSFDEAILHQINQKKPVFQLIWKSAAAAAIAIALGIAAWTYLPGLQPVHNQPLADSSADTYEDPQKALEEAKQALNFASAAFRKGIQPIENIQKFSETKQIISQKIISTSNDSIH